MTSIRRRGLVAATAVATLVVSLAGPAVAAGTAEPSPSASPSGTPSQTPPVEEADPPEDSTEPETTPEPTPEDTTTPTPKPTSKPTPKPTTKPTPEPSPKPSPSSTPTDTGTPEPTEKPEQSAEPDPGTEDPTNDGGSTDPGTTGTTDPGTDSGTNSGTTDPDAAFEAALLDAHTRAVAEASRLLVMAEQALAAADEALEQATQRAESARAASERAQREAAISKAVQERTAGQIDQTAQRIVGARNAVGAMARQAYQGTNLSSIAVVLEAESPDDLTNRYVGIRTMMRAGDSALGDLSIDEANLRNAETRLEAQIAENELKLKAAERTLRDAENAKAAAERAKEAREDKTVEYERALAVMDEARAEDRALYEELLDESLAIGNDLNGLDYGPGYGTGEFTRPGTGPYTSEFGPRFHPILKYTKVHTGLDFGRGDGLIRAADSGTVVTAEFNAAYGYMVVVDHGEIGGKRITTLYAHQPGLMVSVGQRVEKGQHIGMVGSTGYSTGPHLHFEVRVNGTPVDPRPWLS